MNSLKRVLLKNATVYKQNEILSQAYILIEDGKIQTISTHAPDCNLEDTLIITLNDDDKVIPGMIDVHIHGTNGADTMDATLEALDTIVSSLPSEGTTSFLATTITQDSESISKAIINVADYMKNHQVAGKAEILGIHLEGPFVNASKAGAQPVQHIKNPDLHLFKKWQKDANNQIKLVTLAPELTGAMDFIKYLKSQGIISSVGHSDASYQQVVEAEKEGLSHVTHLFNQMTGLHHREPGVAGAALLNEGLLVEIITDGIHVAPEMIQLAFKQKTAEGLLLITDAMRAKCLKTGNYDLGGQQVTVANGKAFLEDGTLAGSVLKMSTAFKNMLSFTNCTISELIKMVAENQAKELGVFDRKGSIDEGKDADLVILNKDHDIEITFCRGVMAYNKGGNRLENHRSSELPRNECNSS